MRREWNLHSGKDLVLDREGSPISQNRTEGGVQPYRLCRIEARNQRNTRGQTLVNFSVKQEKGSAESEGLQGGL